MEGNVVISKKIIARILIGLVIVGVVSGIGYYLLFTGKKVNVDYTEKDYDSFKKKTKIDKPEDVVNTITELTSPIPAPVVTKKPKSTVIIEDTISLAELNAIINKGFVANGIFTSVGLNFIDSTTIEMSAVVGDNYAGLMDMFNLPSSYSKYESVVKGKTVYAKANNFKYLGNNKIELDVTEVKVGQISVPSLTTYAAEALASLGDNLPEVNGFVIDNVTIGPDGVYFKGTVPQS